MTRFEGMFRWKCIWIQARSSVGSESDFVRLSVVWTVAAGEVAVARAGWRCDGEVGEGEDGSSESQPPSGSATEKSGICVWAVRRC